MTRRRFDAPGRVRVGSRTWTLADEPRAPRDQSPALTATTEAQYMRPSGVLGLTLPDTAEMWISRTIRGRLREEVVLHELLHACFTELRDRGEHLLGFNHEERVVEALSPMLLEVLRQCRWRSRK